MKEQSTEIKIPLGSAYDTCLCIYGNTSKTLIASEPEQAAERGESPWQLLEGCFYQYFFEKAGSTYHGVQLRENIVVQNALRSGVSEGRISPNIYVGSLALDVLDCESKTLIETLYVEVLPTKLNPSRERSEDTDYRSNYEFMLGEIAEKSTELLLQIESPVFQDFEIDFNQDAQTIYQRFAFIKALLNNDDFFEAIQKIISSPTSKWATISEMIDVLNVRKFSSKTIRQLSSGSNRIALSKPIGPLNSAPQRIESVKKIETYDTHENRFVKYALQTFLQFTQACEAAFEKSNYEKSRKEAAALSGMLENQLHHSFFNDISRPTVLKLNSPALQRKSGYREVLNAWLKFDLSLRLVWRGGDDVYKAGKRDIAILYEYWLFFKLYDLMVAKFQLNEIKHEDKLTKEVKKHDHLIDVTKDGLQLIVKSGTFTALECEYNEGGWAYNVKFSYNKTFAGKVTYDKKKEGSWTKPLRPDYTLSIWPKALTDTKAEEEGQIVHIHFDSKYKVQHFFIPDSVEEDIEDPDDLTAEPSKIDSLTAEKKSELRGTYKNADLMKMHAYKDAIRRTAGAYILYPGTEDQVPLRGFHEIIPGLGAFSVRPQQSDNGMQALSKFIDDVIANFRNSASQQKKHAVKTYETFDSGPALLEEPMPHGLIPDDTYILVGFYKSAAHLDWIKKCKYYNFRMNDDRGSLTITFETVSAKYLLLHGSGDKNSGELWRIVGAGFRVVDRSTLKRLKYPSPNHPSYLVVKLEKVTEREFEGKKWNFKNLLNYPTKKNSAFPFTASLTELMKNIAR